MKKRMLTLLLAICLLCSCGAVGQTVETGAVFSDVASDAWYADVGAAPHILVAYFSRTGNTAEVADGLSITGATLPHAATLAADWIDGLNLERQQEETAMPNPTIQAGGQTFSATLADNPAARALLERLPMTLTMEELNGNEKYHDLDGALPADARQPGQIQAGDLMLYGSNCLVLFYESFSSTYAYTRLGRIDDPAGLSAALGRGNVEVTFRVS